jgi:uncharacterized protein YqjF (DUF2071 family)
MNTAEAINRPTTDRDETWFAPAFTPLFLGDWMRAVFIHYEVEPEILQNEIPFELDLFAGRAFVSVVAFSMERLRPSFGGRLTELLFRPISNHNFLNVRTYVRHGREAGIYFIAEFLSNPLCVPLGPPTFGLPYRFGRLAYRHSCEKGMLEGEVAAVRGQKRLKYNASLSAHAGFRGCERGTLDAFLLERYTAFTQCGKRGRLFRIWHPPWAQQAIDVSVQEGGLLALTGDWVDGARLIGGNFSPGVHDVRMSRPHHLNDCERKHRVRVFFDV